jgi:hypothetical protein
MTDALHKFERKMMANQRYRMYLRFFELDKDREFLTVPVLSRQNPDNPIIPFRNTRCSSPDCVYDLEDLKTKYKNAMFSSYITFTCYTCKNQIEMENFHLDQDLHKIIKIIWENYNKPGTIRCQTITMMPDGTWEPNMPSYYSKKVNSIILMFNPSKKDSKRTSLETTTFATKLTLIQT